MRPALQRLLSRPSSLELLRCLVGTPELVTLLAPVARSRPWLRRVTKTTRNYTTAGATALSEDENHTRNICDEPEPRIEGPANNTRIFSPRQTLHTEPRESIHENAALSASYYGPWNKLARWTLDEIDFESNLGVPEDPARQRLIDRREHRKDLKLFARLLDHRERIHGMDGIRMFWEAVKKRRIRLPTRDDRESKNRGSPAEKLWTSFLKLGFYDNQVLEEVFAYADELLQTKQRRWPRMYATIVQHFLVDGNGKEALVWHNRLLERHPPSAASFAELCHRTIYHRGDLNVLKEIYDANKYRNAYGRIIPTLCRQGNFKLALEWHFRLLEKGDVPLEAKHTQALSRFLAVYDRRNAILVTKSLVTAGAPFQIPTALSENIKISREIMNLVHGETFKIPVKAYNDDYGARWFATTWVPLDLTIHSIHALGIREIGPLSLQALCLRTEPDGSEPGPDTILRRIEQLRSLGLSIGSSVFSRAIKHFAQNKMYDHLMGLLKGDQHPDALEDWKSLENLLAHFARIRDWEQYRRILAIRTLSSKSPAIEAQNIWLRTLVTNRDLPAALDTLETMQINGTAVKPTTISYILRAVLLPRRRGCKLSHGLRDLDMATSILKGILDAGNLVPAAYWREIICRYGMMRSNSDLRHLCIFLASRYGPTDRSYLKHIGTQYANDYRVPSQVATSHPLHPLKILFPVSLQKAIVEWGFIHALKRAESKETTAIMADNLDAGNKIDRQLTAGISLLKDLHQLGVHINEEAIKKAILNRLIIYYNPGRSTKLYNRVARRYVPDFEIMKSLIDEAMGQRVFGDDLKLKILSRGKLRLLGRARNAKRRDIKR